MGIFFDYITGGNIKVGSNSLARLHHNCKDKIINDKELIYMKTLGNRFAPRILDNIYLTTYCERICSMMHMAVIRNNAKGCIIYEMVRNNAIKNYVHLVALDLNVFAAPNFVHFENTFASFSTQIVHYLTKKDIPIQYITGDNSAITQEAAALAYIPHA